MSSLDEFGDFATCSGFQVSVVSDLIFRSWLERTVKRVGGGVMDGGGWIGHDEMMWLCCVGVLCGKFLKLIKVYLFPSRERILLLLESASKKCYSRACSLGKNKDLELAGAELSGGEVMFLRIYLSCLNDCWILHCCRRD